MANESIWNFNIQEAPSDGTEVIGIDKTGKVKRIKYVTYDPNSIGYLEGRRDWWWQYISDNDFVLTFTPIAWIYPPNLK